jgi:hypothetical protein
MMQQKMPWEEDWDQQQGAPAAMGGYPTITTQRDPRQVAREDSAAARAAMEQQLRQEAAVRDAVRFSERNKPTLPAGYMMGPNGQAVRIPGLPPEKGAEQPGQRDLDSVRAEALDKIRLARTLQQRSRDGWFATGFGASTMGSIGGTGAYDVRQDTETLKNAGALTRIMEMAKQNGGKNPLTPLSNSDFQALASSLSNLDTSQSDGQYQANVQRVIDLYTRAYQGAGGTDLEGDLDPSKRKRRDGLPILGPANSATPPANGANGYGPGSPPPAGPLATGGTKMERNPEREKALDALLRSGASNETINATSRAMGGMDFDDARLNQMRDAVGKGYRGPTFDTAVAAPTTAWNRFAASPLGTSIFGAVDAGMGGLSDELAAVAGGGNLADLNARKQAVFAANPKSALLGQTLGTIGAMTGLGAVSRSAGLGARFANPQLIGDIAFGGVSGAGQSNDNRLIGTALGSFGGIAGNAIGNGAASTIGAAVRTRPGLVVTNGVRRAMGRDPLLSVNSMSPAQSATYSALNRAGLDDVTSRLTEAQNLGMPMSLADTSPNLRELAGAAVRRSPSATAYAENALIPRARGQFDRFTSSVESNLGPTTNIPQRSADMMTQARAAASGLYDRAYANPVPNTPELDAVLATPFGRQALGRARTIAANERRSPSELGFAQDANGNTVLNPRPNDVIAQHLFARQELDAAQEAYRAARSRPGSMDAARNRLEAARAGLRSAETALGQAPDPTVAASVPTYTTQTLDYVKRGMDDVLEEKRSPLTGRLVLDEAGRAQNGVRGQLLSEVDRLNPDFAAARQAYAGPMASRDALARGGDAYSMHPDELAMQVGTQTPEHLGQMQLGYRGAMVDHASRVRDTSNPWEATLGTPASRNRLGAIYPGNAGVDRMLRQRDLEGTMAQTKDAVLGNSKTAGRQIMDKVFEGGGWPLALGEAGLAVLTHGATLPLAMRRFAGEGARDMYKLGVGKRATAKADALAPMLLNVDPGAGMAVARELMEQQRARQVFIEATTPRRLGMAFRGFGSQAALTPLNR